MNGTRKPMLASSLEAMETKNKKKMEDIFRSEANLGKTRYRNRRLKMLIDAVQLEIEQLEDPQMRISA